MHNASIALTVTTLFAVLLTTVIGLSESAGAQGSLAETKRSESPFACNRLALTPEQRKRHFDELGPKLRSVKKSVRELPNGYEFEFPADSTTVQLVAEWAVGERACCPFFDIDMRLEREPYSTLVLFLGLCGRRIEEAIGIKPTDLDDNNALHIRRVIYEGRVEELEEEQVLPLDQPEHAELVRRLRLLGAGHEWIFRSRKGTPLDPGNARRRKLHPAAKAVGVKIGGWHDFRHTLVRKMRRGGVHPVVVSAVVGHKSVQLAPEVYDRADQNEIRAALGVVGKQLLPNVLPSESPN